MNTDISVGSKITFYQKGYYPNGSDIKKGTILSVGATGEPRTLIIEFVGGGYLEILEE